ncbi:DUF302 domain-containing protein [Vreelandella andesensis]|uniref:DUF302 domain-containing protein n=1 Tax=Vreelandella andesensis TaxID=447567 RepID=A0A3S0W316_9GAMM|nr:DUF302 domain-containing protein [Halomonas andesensis]RUR26719.1 DUF302 domain-containing protein [Halomonas andesensis]
MTYLFAYGYRLIAAPVWLLLATLTISQSVIAEEPITWPQEGWNVINTDKSYTTLVDDLRQAVAEADMLIVTEASPTAAAAQRGETIPGNRVIGVFRNDYAVRIIRQSVPAMIEAPLRFYITEDSPNAATLSWKTPSALLMPYDYENTNLEIIANELDILFQRIANNATTP